jgi:hypothetical protein
MTSQNAMDFFQMARDGLWLDGIMAGSADDDAIIR